MDALTYLKERIRMCEANPFCSNCPLDKFEDCERADPEESVAVVKKWSAEHPIKTNGERFLDDNKEHIRTYNRWENIGKPYIEVHIEADWWDDEYKEK